MEGACVAVVTAYESRRRCRSHTHEQSGRISSTSVDSWIDSRPGLRIFMWIGLVLQTCVD
uniref:Uncharacterized protein n=1 Tax=Zea mays TaxID=4577 RepID=C0PA82_MAIZE|nr:unknown [Zea mays]